MNLFDPKTQNPITVTEKAASWIGKQLQARGKGLGIRLGAKPGGCTGWEYIMEFVDCQLIEDRVINDNGITLFIDPKSLTLLDGSQLIFKEEGINCGIEIVNPNSTATCGCGESFSV